ncbi:ATP-binding protein, partial [Nanoarchaeota archaeon]
MAIAVSGGKDSTVCLFILNKLGYNIEAITIDAAIGNYTKQNLDNIKQVCKKYKINLNIISFREEFGMSLCYMRSALKEKGHDYSSCMLCGILKRYLLNKYSKKFKFDYLATGHNLDDEAQAFMMNVFRNDFKLAKRQGPITGIK